MRKSSWKRISMLAIAVVMTISVFSTVLPYVPKVFAAENEEYTTVNAAPGNEGITTDGGFLNAGASGYIEGNINGDEWYMGEGNSISFNFTGTAVKVIGGKNNDMGKADIYLDGKLVETVDCYNADWIKGQTLYEAENLKDTTHTIKVQCNGGKNDASANNIIVCDAFMYIASKYATVNAASGEEGIVTSGGFLNAGASGYIEGNINGDEWYMGDEGNFISFNFSGTAIRVLAGNNADMGIANIYLDGAKVDSVDCYSSSWTKGVAIYEKDNLEDTLHTIKVEVSGSKNDASSGKIICVDAFQYTPSSYTIVNASNDQAGVTTDGGFLNKGASGYIEGNINGDEWYLGGAGESISFQFTGSRIQLIVGKNSDMGKMDIYLDGKLIETVDSYNESWIKGQIIYDSGELKVGQHTIKAVNKGEKSDASSGTITVVDAFRYVKAPEPADSDYVTVNASTNNLGVSASGGFLNAGASGYIDGNIEGDEWYFSGKDEYIQFTFTGTRVRVIAGKNYDMGKSDIYIDDTYIATVDSYNSDWIKGQILFDSGYLEGREHTIKIVNNGTKNDAAANTVVVVDAFQYIPYEVPDNTLITVNNSSASIKYEAGDYKASEGAIEEDITQATGNIESSFVGRYVEIIGPTAENYGKAKVYIDTIFAGTIDASKDAKDQQVLFKSQPLSAATHTLLIVPEEGDTIALDAYNYMSVNSADGSYIIDADQKDYISYTGTPETKEDEDAFGGGVLSVKSGDTLSLNFFGSKVSVFGSSEGDVEVYIDGEKAGNISAGEYGELFREDTLLNTPHTIELKAKSAAKIDYIKYTPDAKIRVNDDEGKMEFSAGFWTGEFAGDDGQTTFIAGGGNMTMEFTGTSVYVYGPKNTNLGICEVYIDGELAGTFDEYSSSWQHQQLVFAAEGLEPCSHTIKIINTNSKQAASEGSYTLVDYIEYDAYEIPSVLNINGATVADENTVIVDIDNAAGRKLEVYDISLKAGSGALNLINSEISKIKLTSDTQLTLTLTYPLTMGAYIEVTGARNLGGTAKTQYLPEDAVKIMGAEVASDKVINITTEVKEGTEITKDNFVIELSKNGETKQAVDTKDYTITKEAEGEYKLTLADSLENENVVIISGKGKLYGEVALEYVTGDKEIINNDDERIEYTGSWVTNDSEGSYKDDVAVSKKTGDALEIPFNGTDAALYGTVAPDGGKVDIYIDGILYKEDLSLKAENRTLNYKFFSIDGLTAGNHIIMVKNVSAGEEEYVSFDAMEYTSCAGSESTYYSINGTWNIAKDETGSKGTSEKWYLEENYPSDKAKDILVPGNVYEAFPDYNGITWYAKTFNGNIAKSFGDRIYLQFEAVQYSCDVYLNGQHLGYHEGAGVPFEFDVTDAINLYGENFLAVRVFNPEGMCKTGSASNYGAFWDAGGIWQEVGIYVRPEVYIDNIYAESNWKTGEVDLHITVENTTLEDKEISLFAEYGQRGKEAIGNANSGKLVASSGESTFTLSYKIDDFKLWSLDNPNLYFASATLNYGDKEHTVTEDHLGFRHFEVKNGYFYLNGERIYLKMTHQNAYDPVTLQASSRDIKYVNKATKQLKEAGFNVFRAIGMECMPEQLDYADEIGILVYSESSQGWLGANNWIESVQDETIIRDRNHPSLVIWGLLNEIYASDSRVEQVRGYLPRLRELDNDRVVFLDSGRFDHDYTVAGVSNSGSSTWDVYFGGEGTSNPSVGDIHTYPQYPMNEDILEYILTVGEGANPVIFSEAGTGAMFNPFVELRGLEAEGAANENNYAYLAWDKNLADGLTEIYNKYGLDSLYDSAEGIPLDSINVNITQRLILINYIRANEKGNGYGVTSLSDSQGLGEGLMDNFRDWKDGYKELMENAWSSLRWSILLNNSNLNVERGDELRLRANITNEDILPAGDYTASFYVTNEEGLTVAILEDEKFSVSSAADAPFAYEVLDQTILADFPEGTYTLNCKLNADYGCANTTMEFVVTDNSDYLEEKSYVTVLGDITDSMREVLEKNGVTLRDYSSGDNYDNEVIFVGKNIPDDAELWRGLYKKIAEGAYAVFLDSSALGTDNNWFPSANKGSREVVPLTMALYHADHLALPDDTLFANLEVGMMDPAYYGEQLLVPRNYFTGLDEPDEMNILMIYSQGLPIIGDTLSGTAMGTYYFHEGAFTINILDLCNETTSPAVGRMLLNLVNYGKEKSSKYTPIEDVAAFEAELDSYNFKDDKVNMPTAKVVDSASRIVLVEFDEPVTFAHDCVYLAESPNPERYQSTGPAEMVAIDPVDIDGKTYAKKWQFTFPTINNLFTNSPLSESGIPAGAGLRFLEYNNDPAGANGKTPNVVAADGRQMKMNYVDGDSDVGFVTITIPAEAMSLRAAGNATSVAVGDTIGFIAEFTPEGTTQKEVTWSVEDGTGSATIDEFGKLTGVSAGTVTVKAVSVADETVAADMIFEIHSGNVMTDAKLNGVKDSYYIGEKVSFEVTGGGLDNEKPVSGDKRWMPLSWATANKSEKFDGNYKQSFTTSDMLKGDYTLSIKLACQRFDGKNWVYTGEYDEITAKYTISTKSVAEITISGKTQMEVGSTQQLKAEVLPDDATDSTFTWVSEDDGIATVDENGVVKAISVGKVRIAAIANDGSEAYGEIEINVIDSSTPVEPENPTTPDDDSTTGTKTGDSSDLLLLAVAMVMTLIAAGAVLLKKIRKEN